MILGNFRGGIKTGRNVDNFWHQAFSNFEVEVKEIFHYFREIFQGGLEEMERYTYGINFDQFSR